MEELKPCPYCGGNGHSYRYHNIMDTLCHRVYCTTCGAEIKDYLTKEEAISAWNTRVSGWIPASERLPEEGQVVLVNLRHITIGNPISVAWFVDGGWSMERLPYHIDSVTHWMPLPKAPTDVKGDQYGL